MRLTLIAATALMIPAAGFAAGSDDSTPPTTTPTSSSCEAGQVFDKDTKTCVDKSSSLLDMDERYEAVRELAYAEQYDRALGVLDEMDQAESRVLTYRGFIARKTGDVDSANSYYLAALEANADNILARSYYGQGLAANGDRAGAKLQLAEIRARGGRNTWAEFALRQTLETGASYNY